MKKGIAFFLSLVMLLCLFPAASVAVTEYITITLDANGGCFWNDPNTTSCTLQAPKGGTCTRNGEGVAVPSRDNYSFVGWYLHADGSGEQVDYLNYTPTYTKDITFYAKWKKWEPSGTCGENLKWSFDEASHTLTITGTGAMEDFEWERRPWEPIRDQIQNLSLPSGLTYIGNLAFHECQSLKSVTIPATVKKIGRSPFRFCLSLTSVTILGDAEGIDGFSFDGCSALMRFKVGSGCKTYTVVDDVLFSYDKSTLIVYPEGKGSNYIVPSGVKTIGRGAFYDNISLKSVTFPDGLISIESDAFNWCPGLTAIAFPNSVTQIGGYAFYHTGLSSVTIPGSVTSFSGSTFAGCAELTAIQVDKNNKNYIAVDGVVFSKEKTQLVAYPSGRKNTSYTIPDGVTTIGLAAFQQCAELTSVTIPRGVASIGAIAFAWCEKLTSITIPVTVANIHAEAFRECEQLKDVYYSGTKAAREKMMIDNYNNPLLNATWHYGTEEPIEPPVITAQPKNATVKNGEKATFTVKASGKNLSYQWYSWSQDDPNWTPVGGATNNTYTVVGTKDNNEWFFRCCVKNEGGEVYSNEAYLSVVTAEAGYIIVTLDANGGCFHGDPNWTIDYETAPIGGTSTKNGQGPGTPSREGYAFVGWYLHADGSGEAVDPWHYTPTYTKDITFYAKWKKWQPSGTCGKNLTWSFDEATGKLTITGSGAMEDFERDRSPWSPVCGKIKSLSLPSGLTYIGNWAFKNCRELTSVSVPATVTAIGIIAFSNCSKLSSLSLPNGLTSLGTDCFEHCSSLTAVNIPNTVTELGSYAFGHTGLTSVTVPSSVTTLYGSTFAGCTGLTAIQVDKNNKNYIAINGVVFSKDKSELVAYPSGRKSASYTIPDGVTTIREAAFQECAGLTSIVIPRGVTSIGWRTFAWCEKLASVTMPVTITNIEDQAFVDDNQLKDVHYGGTKAARGKITIASGNDKLLEATWHYGTEEAPDPIAPPTITTQPKDVNVKNGEQATFTVKATGDGKIEYQWYSRPNAKADWTLVNGATKDTYTVTGTRDNNGWQFRCRIKNEGGEVYSNAATLTVTLPAPPTIKTQPKSAKVKSGSKAKFAVKAKEKDVTYQWFSRASAKDEWKEMKGETKATLTVVGTGANNGWQYRCRLRNKAGGEVYSNIATLTVTLQKPVIKTQPKSLSVKSGKKAKFSVKASGKNITYQWFTRADAKSAWKPVPGSNKNTLNVVASKANNGSQYYCYLKNADGDATSVMVTLTVATEKPIIKTQPKSLTVKSGAKAKFTVKASGKNLKYTWYSRPNANGEWKVVAGQTKNSLTIVASKANSGTQYYCKVQNLDGSVDSAVVTLTVTPEAPTIKTQPKDAKVKIGGKAKFKVKATGKNVTYQWYYRTSETGEWVLMKGETSANLTVVATADMIGWQFRCLAKNADGQVYSKVATLRQK